MSKSKFDMPWSARCAGIDQVPPREDNGSVVSPSYERIRIILLEADGAKLVEQFKCNVGRLEDTSGGDEAKSSMEGRRTGPFSSNTSLKVQYNIIVARPPHARIVCARNGPMYRLS